jgi:ferredoxin
MQGGFMRIVADKERCVSGGLCVLTGPTLFDQDEIDGTVVILTEQVEGNALQKAQEAVHLCPGQALSLIAE